LLIRIRIRGERQEHLTAIASVSCTHLPMFPCVLVILTVFFLLFTISNAVNVLYLAV